MGVGPELRTFGSRVSDLGWLFLNQSVLGDFEYRKKKDSHFRTRSLSGTSNNNNNNNNINNNNNNSTNKMRKREKSRK